ncbi:MAG: AAA family ATPase [Oscillospiraceae bacterium]|nr:AAA family ATPase [Oscillospiraceae bacterium]
MQLLRFRVTNFRSIEDSGWVDCNDVTTLVGVNESGKSNVLLALWKLNPAREGNIDVLHDLPVSKQSSLRNEIQKVRFIEAEFILDEESKEVISKKANCTFEKETIITVSKYYDGHRTIGFDKYPLQNQICSTNEDGEETEIVSEEEFNKVLTEVTLDEIPKFVYYSNYGNLSSRIYLPYVVKWLNGETITGIDTNEEQVRTLRVLFDFVKLNPEEILELGKDPKDIAKERTKAQNPTPNPDDILKAEKNKEQRSILLQSASGELTRKFKNWWNQGEYKFRFEADGDYFNIWVSDKIRPDEVALELRSTGLQWFISFYLIFLVESQEQHKNSVLLLDEAGLTLHPMAQKDLSKFFDNLSENNQIVHTTHSPFIIDTTNIDRCRVVYMDEEGYTVVSSDLRQGAASLNEHSIYAVHAAMGLSVSDILLQGCQPIVVEGPSDQHYLNAIKTFIIKEKIICPKQELVFMPSGGVKGISGVVSIVSSKADELPFVIVDSDKNGKDAVNKLQSGLYKESKSKIIDVQSLTNMDNSEVEDIIPYILVKRYISRLFNTVEDDDFEDDYDDTLPLVPQIEAFAQKYSIDLEKGWKVDMAKSAKNILKSKSKSDIDSKYVDVWKSLFTKLNK